MTLDFKVGDALPALAAFLLGLRILLGLDRLTHRKLLLMTGFCVGALTALLFIETIFPDKGTSIPPVGLSPLYGPVLRISAKRKRRRYGKKDARMARRLRRIRGSERRAQRKLDRAAARKANSIGKQRRTAATVSRLQKYIAESRASRNPYLTDKQQARVRGAQLASDVMASENKVYARFRGSPYEKGRGPIGPVTGGIPAGKSPFGVGKALIVGGAAAVATAYGEETVERGLNWMFRNLPANMNPTTYGKLSPSFKGAGIGIYFRNILLGLMNDEAYAGLRATASRAINEKLRAM